MNNQTILHRPFSWELGLFAPSVSQLTFTETITLLSKMDYHWVEWRVQTTKAIESSPWGKASNTIALDHILIETQEIASLLDGSGVKVAALQVDVAEDFPDQANKVLDAACIMKCPRILLTTPCFNACIGYRSQRDAFQERLAGWVELFSKHSIRVCLETHFGTITPSSALATDVLQGFDPANTGVMWDPANQVQEGSEIPSMVLNLLGSYLAEVHLKNGEWSREEDGKWNFNFCDLSRGIVQWPVILRLLNEMKYTGPLVVEDYRWTDPQDKLARAREELEKAIEFALETE